MTGDLIKMNSMLLNVIISSQNYKQYQIPDILSLKLKKGVLIVPCNLKNFTANPSNLVKENLIFGYLVSRLAGGTLSIGQ